MCSVIGATPTPRATSRVTTSWRERPAGRRHLGAARLGAEDGLVGRERVVAVEVAVADRPAAPPEGAGQVAVDPRPATAGCRPGRGRVGRRVGRDAASAATPPTPTRSPGARVQHGPGRVGRGPQLDDPAAVVEPGADVQHDRGVVEPACSAARVQLAGDGRGVVDDQQVAGSQVVGQVGEPRVPDAAPGSPTSSRTSSRRQPAGLGRRRGEGGGRRRERRGRAQRSGSSCGHLRRVRGSTSAAR